jgi:hypothetical protein
MGKAVISANTAASGHPRQVRVDGRTHRLEQRAHTLGFADLRGYLGGPQCARLTLVGAGRPWGGTPGRVC